MGCDIHMTVERKIGGGWHCIWDGNIQPQVTGMRFPYPAATQRNYDFFADLAGVRGEGPDPRGLPNDISPVTQYQVDCWGSDGHSHSWLPLLEFCELWDKPRTDEEKLAYTTAVLKEEPRRSPSNELFGMLEDEHLDDCRVVFWFDN